MHHYNKTLTTSLIAGALALGISAAVHADADEMEGVDQAALDLYENEVASGSGDLRAEDVTDEDLENFLVAAQAVSGVREQRLDMIREMPSDRAAPLIEAAASAMQDNIEVNDLTVEEYRQIAYLVHNDDEVRERLNAVAAGM